MTTTYVSFNYQCDRATGELGEDHHILAGIERAYRLLEARLERGAVAAHSDRATRAILELGELLADARHDASFGSTLALAADAHGEAMVRPVEIKSKRAA